MAAPSCLNIHATPPEIRISDVSLGSSLSENPRPVDFDAFLPWICLEMQSPVTVTVIRIIKEDYVRPDQRRLICKSDKSLKSAKSLRSMYEEKSITTKMSSITKHSKNKRSSDSSVPIQAYYDVRGNLVEISVVSYPLSIHKKIIQAISICLPFHSLLCKLTIRSADLTSTILHEIGELLQHSNLTNICLDDANVPEANYNVLLENTSQLKTLSLNRCRVSDAMCIQLAESIDFGKPGCNLMTLELGSNFISDIGAQAFGDVLRRNRHLLHLNLSGNMITDIGAMSIFINLMDFRLTHDEITETRRSKVKYIHNKAEIYERCIKEVRSKPRSNTTARKPLRRTRKFHKNFNTKFRQEESNAEAAEKMTIETVGTFIDPFCSDFTFKRNGYNYCSGNMFLCSLNLAYNNLEYPSIKKLHEVLKYQDESAKPPGTTGLLRVGIDGNNIPKYCGDYDEICILLKKAISYHNQKRSEVVPSTKNHKHFGRKRMAMIRRK